MTGIEDSVLSEIEKVVVGRKREAELLLVALLARGNVLLEGVPGVSKTTIAKAFSNCLGLQFRRMQFTPDMLPMDIVGGFVFDAKEREFKFRRGPVFTNILLADEINRAPPKVQSALLEAMQERQVTVEGHTEPLPSPFMVIATQNPVEFQGVYPLPEGQLDRFTLKIVFDYPGAHDESEIIRKSLGGSGLTDVKQVVTSEALGRAIEEVEKVEVSSEIIAYLTELARVIRQDKRVSLGASPRAMAHLAQAARALAYVEGRDYVSPDDVKNLGWEVLVHRMRLNQSALISGEAVEPSIVVRDAFARVAPPR